MTEIHTSKAIEQENIRYPKTINELERELNVTQEANGQRYISLTKRLVELIILGEGLSLDPETVYERLAHDWQNIKDVDKDYGSSEQDRSISHIERVAGNAFELGAILWENYDVFSNPDKELSSEAIKNIIRIVFIADMHDIAKGIKNFNGIFRYGSILNSMSDNLSKEERLFMAQHAPDGAVMLEQIGFNSIITNPVRDHHATLTMNPSEIPIETAIVTLCDQMDFMRFPRPFIKSQDRKTPQQIREDGRIDKALTHFDNTNLTNAFLTWRDQLYLPEPTISNTPTSLST